MTREEFSTGFDTLVNSYKRFKAFDKQEILDSIEFDEYEKSFYLTKAQEQLVINLYNGHNILQEGFEGSEQLRRSLATLIRHRYSKVYDGALREQLFTAGTSLYEYFLDADTCPCLEQIDDMLFIIEQHVVLEDDDLGCYNGQQASVIPVTFDEWNTIKDNPFRGPTKYKVLVIDDNTIEKILISKYKVGQYYMSYLSRPTPIILENLPEGVSIEGIRNMRDCNLPEFLHQTILENAVQLALTSKAIGANSES